MFPAGAIVALAFALPMQQPPCTTSPAQVVDDIYKQVLERPADPASAPFSYALGSGDMTVRDIVIRLAQSPEHLSRFLWEPLVTDIYRQTLRRSPSPDEEQAAMRQLATGVPVSGLMARIEARTAGSHQQAVQMLYRRLLGREPDPDGLRVHVAIAERDGIDAVMRSIMNSPEYRARAGQRGTERDDVTLYSTGVAMLYRHMLNRRPDPEGLAAMTQLAAVYGLPEVAHRLGNSREYLERWGDQAVPGNGGIRFCGSGEISDRQRALPRQRSPFD